MTRSKLKNILSGILLIGLSVCLILWKMNILVFPFELAGVSTWGLILAVVLVVIFFHSLLDFFYPGVFFPLAGLAIIFDDVLGITAITPWIVLLVALLLSIAFEKLIPSSWTKRHVFKHFKKENKGINFDNVNFDNVNFDKVNFNNERSTAFTDDSNDENEYVFHSIKMGDASKYIRSNNLKTADLSVEFGELRVYFDKAEVPCGEVKIQTRVAVGEMDLYIPRSWNVVNKTSAAFGDSKDNKYEEVLGENPVKCVIEGSVSFGELNIIRV
ncbi:MAG: hypothetical protein IJ796_08975 [Lachnospiraceae bacterium]|nr:hypothetical protein [Lachnospiraceae bacterium]